MAPPSYSQLAELLAQKDRRIAELEQQLAAALGRIAELEKLLEARTRDGKRQAAPFSKGEPKASPDKPGRKAGEDYGTKAFRSIPDRDPDEIIDVPLPNSCPHCGGCPQEEHVDEQFQVEIPRRPVLRRFDLHVGVCTRCGRHLRARHPLQTSDAVGAAASQIGPDTQALIALAKNKLGLSYGDITELLHDGFGIDLTRGAAAHIVRRAGERAEPVYDAIRAMVPQADTVYPDETGWKVGGRRHWLWTFVTGFLTLYVIRPSRGVDVPAEVLGMDYRGRMGHDGWAVYDQFTEAIHQQCLQHLLRRAKELIEQQGLRGGRFARRVQKFLLDALALRNRHREKNISEHGFAVARGRLEKRLDRLLTLRPKAEADRRFLNHLARHRDQLLTFLYEENLEATNWPAEQAIRPAVVNRKVCGGNRTPTGAHALEVLASLFATCRQNALDTLAVLSNLLRTPTPRTTQTVLTR